MTTDRMAIVGYRLADLERVIARGVATFVEVGEALMEIRDGRLYRPKFTTFELYCRERWGWSRVHADRQIRAAKVAAELKPIGFKNESQARALAPLARETPQGAREVMDELSGDNDGPTAAKIAQAVARRRPGKRKEQVEDQIIRLARNLAETWQAFAMVTDDIAVRDAAVAVIVTLYGEIGKWVSTHE